LKKEIGKDGNNSIANNANSKIAKDVFSYSLNYFTGDYAPISGNNNWLAQLCEVFNFAPSKS